METRDLEDRLNQVEQDHFYRDLHTANRVRRLEQEREEERQQRDVEQLNRERTEFWRRWEFELARKAQARETPPANPMRLRAPEPEPAWFKYLPEDDNPYAKRLRKNPALGGR